MLKARTKQMNDKHMVPKGKLCNLNTFLVILFSSTDVFHFYFLEYNQTT